MHDESSRCPDPVEQIRAGGQLIALILRANVQPKKTEFITSDDLAMQIGLVVYPSGGEVPRHVHNPIERCLEGTSEVIFVRSGRCFIDFYDDERRPIASREMVQGDLTYLVSGGHGFRMLEDTVLLEVKQGPYTGLDEKERF